MVETTSHEMLQKNEITPSQAHAISRVLGHSPSTALRSYVSSDTYIAVSQAQTAEKALGIAMDDCDADNSNNYGDIQLPISHPESVVVPIEYQQKQFGKLHPHYASEKNRIPFSVIEKNWLSDLVNANRIEGKIPENITAICLKAIRSDAELIPHFHIRHVLTTQRLRPGLQAIKICK